MEARYRAITILAKFTESDRLRIMARTQPSFSVIIPTYNRPRQLADCLAALEQSKYPRERFEIIVVDDGSAVPPESAIAAFHCRLEIRLFRQANAGPSAARNTGAAKANGRILAFSDDDCAPAPEWLQTMAARFAVERDPVIIGGRTLNVLSDNIFATASQLIVDVGYAYHNTDPNRARFFTANNLCIPADDFHRLGGFDVSFATTASEDRELCGRWLHQGYRMIYAPEAVVYHAHALTWRTFWQQHLNYGRGALLLQRARRRQGWQLFKPDARYYRQLLCSSIAERPRQRALSLTALLIASQTANAAGMALEWATQCRAKPVCPVKS